ncbi:hypothetical protein KAH27_06825 [bacterium]|nr:hypothetical protein [bacterium]
MKRILIILVLLVGLIGMNSCAGTYTPPDIKAPQTEYIIDKPYKDVLSLIMEYLAKNQQYIEYDFKYDNYDIITINLIGNTYDKKLCDCGNYHLGRYNKRNTDVVYYGTKIKGTIFARSLGEKTKIFISLIYESKFIPKDGNDILCISTGKFEKKLIDYIQNN